ncbi:RadC family protein [Spongiimicrobium salis]|uniref:RadC family protein n=1 Tax=Spongiimicrobium salis TaxID=1667022 RepID=UPI00374CD2D9
MVSSSLPIKYWSKDDKPREKLAQKGKTTLSDAELLAILIGTGVKNESAVSLSRKILASVSHNLRDLGKLSVTQLKEFKGIGEAKAITIVAALEMGRRRREERAREIVKITGSNDVFTVLHSHIGELPHEEFWIIYLNNSNNIMDIVQLSKGGITGTIVDIRLVLKKALELGAIALILAHNHPSGTLKPSASDKKMTKRIQSAAEALDIKVLDHLIITRKDYFSFADNQLL